MGVLGASTFTRLSPTTCSCPKAHSFQARSEGGNGCSVGASEGSGFNKAMAQAWSQAVPDLGLSIHFNLTPVGELPPLSEMCFPYMELCVCISIWELLCG